MREEAPHLAANGVANASVLCASSRCSTAASRLGSASTTDGARQPLSGTRDPSGSGIRFGLSSSSPMGRGG